MILTDEIKTANRVSFGDAADTAGSESKHLEYKSTFDPKNRGAWCELIKDIVAIANAAGGKILFGVRDDGTPLGHDLTALQDLDPIDFIDKMKRYTSAVLPDLKLTTLTVDGQMVYELLVGCVSYPIVFEKEGTYDGEGGKPKVAFRVGVIYIRRAGEASPASSAELREMIDARINARNDMLCQVIKAPSDASIVIHEADAMPERSSAEDVRISSDPDAPEYSIDDTAVARLYPFDYGRLTRYVRKRVPGFLANRTYHRSRKALESQADLCHHRYLDPARSRSTRKRLYSQQAADLLVAELTEVFSESVVTPAELHGHE